METKVPNYKDVLENISKDKNELIQKGKEMLEKLEKQDIHLLLRDELPEKMKTIPDPPYWLFIQGNRDIIYDGTFIAVVGTRNPTEKGKRAVELIIDILSNYPVKIISGLAKGIDEWVHEISLSKSLPNVAFLGCGIKKIFPSSTVHLRKKIVQYGGAVISEYLPYETYEKYKFIRRNRLQAALADLVIPVQAKEKSGTAHTVNYAKRYNKLIVGFLMDENNSIKNILSTSDCLLVDIFKKEGRMQLDKLVQNLLQQRKVSFDVLANIKKTLNKELYSRYISEDKLQELINFINDVWKSRKDTLTQTRALDAEGNNTEPKGNLPQ